MGGVLFLSHETFERATLRTFDGNDYFATHDLEIHHPGQRLDCPLARWPRLDTRVDKRPLVVKAAASATCRPGSFIGAWARVAAPVDDRLSRCVIGGTVTMLDFGG